MLPNLISSFRCSGGAIDVSPDTSALAALAEHWEDVNHLYVLENFLRRMLSTEAGQKCDLTATLSDNGHISVVLAAAKMSDAARCKAASKELVESINNPPKKVANSILKPVAASAKEVPNKLGSGRTGKILGALNPLNGVTDMLNKAGELPKKAQEEATKSVNNGLKKVAEKTDEWEAGISGASGSSTCLATLAIALVAGTLMTM